MNPGRFVVQPLLALLAINLLIAGCASPTTMADDPISIAKQEAYKRGWKKVEVSNSRFVDGRWLVTLWQLPLTPDHYVIIEVSPDGRVIGASSGR
jgi:hypothetical protein